MRRAAWFIFAGVIAAFVALVAAEVLDERKQHQAWLTQHKGVDW